MNESIATGSCDLIRITLSETLNAQERQTRELLALVFQFDAVDLLTFQQKILMYGFNGLGTVVLSLISENPRSRFLLKLILLLCRF